MSVNNYECPKCHNIFPELNKFLHDIHCTETNPFPINQSRIVFLEENINQNNQNNNSNQNNLNNHNYGNRNNLINPFQNNLNNLIQNNINSDNENNLNYNNQNNINNRIQNNINIDNENNINYNNQNNINNCIQNNINFDDENNLNHNQNLPHRPQPRLGLRNEPINHRDIFYNIRESIMKIPQTFDCWLCGQTLPLSQKIDHMICHLMQNENEIENAGNPRNEQNNLNQNQRQAERNQRSRDPSALNRQRIRELSALNHQRYRERRNPSPLNRQNNNQSPRRNNQNRQPNNNQMNIPNNNVNRRQGNNNRQNNNTNRNRNNLVVDIPSFRNEDIFHNRLNQLRLNRNFQADVINRRRVRNMSLPETKIDNISSLDSDRKSCSICLCDYIIGDTVIILPCIHMYHSKCISEWLKNQDFCPLCKIK
jgi:hypothetical protein